MLWSDLAIISESARRTLYNPGFIVVRPTSLSINAYRLVKNITTTSEVTIDMIALTTAIQMLKIQKNMIKVTFLDKRVYMNGKRYFQIMKRLLPRADDPCSSIRKINCSVLVVHNNWIIGKEAKIYRFREHLMWLYDGENRYYSSQTRNYLTYTNTNPKQQVSALITALSIGYLLNRTVILPKFYCSTRTKVANCPLNSLLYMKTFDAIFSNNYRENSFLQHPRVPYVVKRYLSNQSIILATTHSQVTENVNTITSNDIIRLFENSKDKVINFGSLNGVHVKFSSYSIDNAFNSRIRNAFKLSDYIQFSSRKFK